MCFFLRESKSCFIFSFLVEKNFFLKFILQSNIKFTIKLDIIQITHLLQSRNRHYANTYQYICCQDFSLNNLYLKSMNVSNLSCYQDHTRHITIIVHFIFNINKSIIYVHEVVNMVHVEFYPTLFYIHLVYMVVSFQHIILVFRKWTLLVVR